MEVLNDKIEKEPITNWNWLRRVTGMLTQVILSYLEGITKRYVLYTKTLDRATCWKTHTQRVFKKKLKNSVCPSTHLMFLMSFKQSFRSSNIFGEFICWYDGFHIIDPRNKISKVCQKSMQKIGFIEFLPAFLQNENRENQH